LGVGTPARPAATPKLNLFAAADKTNSGKSLDNHIGVVLIRDVVG
jgi:hypothetical protein